MLICNSLHCHLSRIWLCGPMRSVKCKRSFLRFEDHREPLLFNYSTTLLWKFNNFFRTDQIFDLALNTSNLFSISSVELLLALFHFFQLCGELEYFAFCGCGLCHKIIDRIIPRDKLKIDPRRIIDRTIDRRILSFILNSHTQLVHVPAREHSEP